MRYNVETIWPIGPGGCSTAWPRRPVAGSMTATGAEVRYQPMRIDLLLGKLELQTRLTPLRAVESRRVLSTVDRLRGCIR